MSDATIALRNGLASLISRSNIHTALLGVPSIDLPMHSSVLSIRFSDATAALGALRFSINNGSNDRHLVNLTNHLEMLDWAHTTIKELHAATDSALRAVYDGLRIRSPSLAIWCLSWRNDNDQQTGETYMWFDHVKSFLAAYQLAIALESLKPLLESIQQLHDAAFEKPLPRAKKIEALRETFVAKFRQHYASAYNTVLQVNLIAGIKPLNITRADIIAFVEIRRLFQESLSSEEGLLKTTLDQLRYIRYVKTQLHYEEFEKRKNPASGQGQLHDAYTKHLELEIKLLDEIHAAALRMDVTSFAAKMRQLALLGHSSTTQDTRGTVDSEDRDEQAAKVGAQQLLESAGPQQGVAVGKTWVLVRAYCSESSGAKQQIDLEVPSALLDQYYRYFIEQTAQLARVLFGVKRVMYLAARERHYEASFWPAGPNLADRTDKALHTGYTTAMGNYHQELETALNNAFTTLQSLTGRYDGLQSVRPFAHGTSLRKLQQDWQAVHQMRISSARVPQGMPEQVQTHGASSSILARVSRLKHKAA